MINAEVFKQIFGIYATELWAMSESEFLEWLNAKHIATDSRPKDAWIPCSERLPEINKVVLITNEQGNVSYGQFRGTYGDYWRWRKNTLAKVTAWMPLPPSYRGDENETD